MALLIVALLVAALWFCAGGLGFRFTEVDPDRSTRIFCVLWGGVFLLVTYRDSRHPERFNRLL